MSLRFLGRLPRVFTKPSNSQRPPCAFCTAPSSYLHHRKLDVQVGASLHLSLESVNVDVDVHTGDNLEQIEIKSLWTKHAGFLDLLNPFIRQHNCIYVELQMTEAHQFLQNFAAVMPSRWCSLFLSAGKGHVTVQNMKEANLNIVTNGGNVTLGEVRGNEAAIESNGGRVSAVLITAALKMRTSGGVISLEKVIGTNVQIDSGGGDIKLGSAYGQDINITSGGGCISIKHLQSQELCHVVSNGGHVQIDGLDGNVIISTNDGHIHLQLLANAKQVKINAGAGDVTLFMPSEESAKFRVEQIKGESCAENCIYPRAQDSLAEASKERCLSTCNVCIYGSGKVKIIRRSWLESVMTAGSNLKPVLKQSC